MAKEIATKTKLDTRIAADIAAAMPVASKPVAAKAALASEVAKKAIVIDTEEVQAAAEQVVDSSSADVIVAQAAGASSSAAAGGAAAGGMSTTALVVAGVAVAAAAGSSSSSSTPAAATPAPAPAPAPTPTGVTVALTSNATPDIISLTAGANDTVNSAAGTLAAADVITDGSQADEDVLNITLNGYVAATTPTVINVENINVIGNYATTGLALTNVNGAKALNLSAGINGATATVIDASAVKATTINAGANVGTVAVTALAAGTSGVVTTNAGTATTVTITGGAGADQMTTNLAAASTFTVDGGAGGTDTFVVNMGGGANTMTIGTTQTIENFTLNTGGSAANTITLGSSAILVGNAATNAMVVGGTQALTITGDLDAVVNTTRTTGIALTKAAGAGALQFTSNAAMAAAGGFMNEALFDTIRLGTVAIGNNLTINENSTLQLAFNQGTITFDVDNNTTTAIAAGGGTLKLDLAGATVAANTTDSLTTGVGVGTTIITNNGAAAGTITVLNTAATATSVDTVVVSGTKDLTVGTWTATANELFNAAGLSGSLTLTIGANAATVIGGSGSDLLTGGNGLDLIRGGAGNDRINGGGNNVVDTLTGGDGVDTFIMNGAATDVITDFTLNDVIGLSLAAVGTMNDGDSAAVTVGTLARVVHVSAATTLAAGQNVIVLDGTFANAAAVETAIEAGGTRQLTFTTNIGTTDDIVVVWTNGTNAFVSTYADPGTAAATLAAACTLTPLLQLSGVTSVDNFSSNNFIVLA